MKRQIKQLALFTVAGVSLLTGMSKVASADYYSGDTTKGQKVVLPKSTTNQVGIKLQPQSGISGYTALAQTAKDYLGTGYVWGGTTPSGFDCSGYTKYVYQKALGYTLPRTAQAQFDAGETVSEADAQKGDLVFFGSSQSNITHVGIYLGNGKMIDSQNRGVVVENIHANWWNLVGFAHYDVQD